MRVAGIVSEFNPFHNGHQYLLDRVRERGATHIVAVMSGNFVQRGEAAFFDKFLRAEAAVRCGVDLVVDLPVPWSLGGAQTFARGGVALLSAVGCDTIAFGCETPDLPSLAQTAQLLLDEEILHETASVMRNGVTYPAALRQTLLAHGAQDSALLIDQPNNVLAVEYLKAVYAQNSIMQPLAVQRIGQGHDSPVTDGAIQSAAAIRSLPVFADAKPWMPAAAYDVFSLHPERMLDRQNYGTAVLTALRIIPEDTFEQFVDDRSGLIDRLRVSVRGASTLEELYQAAKTKSVTLSKVRRAVMQLFLQIPVNAADGTPPYLRILAANERGLGLLSSEKNSLPVVTKHAETAALDATSRELYALQCRTGDLYALCTKEKRACGLEQTSSIQIIRSSQLSQPRP